MKTTGRSMILPLFMLLLGGCMQNHDLVKGCIYGDCTEGKGIERDDRGNLYIGNWSKGKRNGIGTLHRYAGGQRFYGNWQDGRKEGTGTLVLATGTISGNWLYDHPHGEMTYTGTDGKFSGQLTRDLSPEEGELIWPSGARYRGFFTRAKGISAVPRGAGELEINGEVIKGTFSTRATDRYPFLGIQDYVGVVETVGGTRKYRLKEKKGSPVVVFEFAEIEGLKPSPK